MPSPPLRPVRVGRTRRACGTQRTGRARRRRCAGPRDAAAGHAAAARQPPGAAMTADEVTRTLASLADLRDRGAISAEEYEAKKADLLRRL